MSVPSGPIAITASAAEVRKKPSSYPEPFASRLNGRVKRPLGDVFGLKNFGVNLTTLPPGGISAFRHAHTKQDEFIYIVSGRPTLVTDAGETVLESGQCAGFASGTGNAHMLANNTDEAVTYLEIGDRTPGDTATYPDEDLKAELVDGAWRFFHKDGTPY